MSADATSLRLAMVARLAESGDLHTDAWRPVFETVARHRFLPDRFWASGPDDNGYREVDRASDPHAWLRAAYADVAAVTQFAGGPIGGPPGPNAAPTSSASQPSAVAKMLECLDVQDAQRVLEVGAGTGYNAALLAARVGQENVTTVDVDPALTTAAREALDAAGYQPHVITSDGTHGWAPHAPYDRLISTASAAQVPYAWIEQTRPGAVIVLPRANPLYGWGTIRLTVNEDGTASGPFVGLAGFMPLRSHSFSAGSLRDIIRPHEGARASTTDHDPLEIFDDSDAQFTASVHLPDVRCQRTRDPASGTITIWLADLAGQSWATIRRTHGAPAWDWFGLTVTPERQYIWYDSPDSAHTWPVPTP